MVVLKDYSGRSFKESNRYHAIERHIAVISSNKLWLSTVDKCKEINEETGEVSDKIIIRVIRWKARNDKQTKHLKYWMFHRGYNIRSFKEWSATSEIVNSLIDKGDDASIFIYSPEGDHEQTNKSEEKIIELTQKIDELNNIKSANLVQLRLFKEKFRIMKANIKEYENVLSQFKLLIDRDDSIETEIHKFIENNKAFWLFGLEYVNISSKVSFPPGNKDYEFDIMLQRHDYFWDLVELKGPNERLFDKRTNKRNKPNQKLSEAIGQVFTYLRACDDRKLKNILKPKALIVIGKDKTGKVEDIRLFSSYLHNVELITYSELYKRGKKLLEYIKTSNLPVKTNHTH